MKINNETDRLETCKLRSLKRMWRIVFALHNSQEFLIKLETSTTSWQYIK